MNMHAMNMWLTDTATVVVGADGLCTHGATMMGVSLRARHDTTQVMLGGVTAGQARHNSSNVGGCHCGPGATQLK